MGTGINGPSLPKSNRRRFAFVGVLALAGFALIILRAWAIGLVLSSRFLATCFAIASVVALGYVLARHLHVAAKTHVATTTVVSAAVAVAIILSPWGTDLRQIESDLNLPPPWARVDGPRVFGSRSCFDQCLTLRSPFTSPLSETLWPDTKAAVESHWERVSERPPGGVPGECQEACVFRANWQNIELALFYEEDGSAGSASLTVVLEVDESPDRF